MIDKCCFQIIKKWCTLDSKDEQLKQGPLFLQQSYLLLQLAINYSIYYIYFTLRRKKASQEKLNLQCLPILQRDKMRYQHSPFLIEIHFSNFL